MAVPSGQAAPASWVLSSSPATSKAFGSGTSGSLTSVFAGSVWPRPFDSEAILVSVVISGCGKFRPRMFWTIPTDIAPPPAFASPQGSLVELTMPGRKKTEKTNKTCVITERTSVRPKASCGTSKIVTR